MDFVTRPFRSLDAWVRHLSAIDIPVLPATAALIAELTSEVETTDAQTIARIVSDDPLMSVKLYRLVAERRGRRQLTDIETIAGCVVMLGVPPFFEAFQDLRPVTEHFHTDMQAQLHLLGVLKRSRRAANHAAAWAVRRQDLDHEVIRTAALLHDFAEMLLWCSAPELAREIARRQADNPGLRSVEAQKAVLGTTLNELEAALLKRWGLPELLIRIVDDSVSGDVQERNVTLAVALARHSSKGWDDPALPDDFAALGRLLNVSPARAQEIVEEEEAFAWES
ncbi:MAG: HDOD domain-containing protein [Burkholderiales bacterium]